MIAVIKTIQLFLEYYSSNLEPRPEPPDEVSLMKSIENYFVIKDVKRTDSGKLRLAGQFVLNGETQIDVSKSSASGNGKSKRPPVRLDYPDFSKFRWVLPPEPIGHPDHHKLMFEIYDELKDFAESGGHDPIRHEDLPLP